MKNKLDLEKMTKEELIKEVLRLSEANTKYFENWEKEKKEMLNYIKKCAF